MTSALESSNVRLICSPPGTSPTPVRPALSRRMTILRVKNGACAPDRLSSMSSCPATGTTRISVFLGEEEFGRSVIALLFFRFCFGYLVWFHSNRMGRLLRRQGRAVGCDREIFVGGRCFVRGFPSGKIAATVNFRNAKP